MKRIITTAIIVIALAVPVWAETVSAEYILMPYTVELHHAGEALLDTSVRDGCISGHGGVATTDIDFDTNFSVTDNSAWSVVDDPRIITTPPQYIFGCDAFEISHGMVHLIDEGAVGDWTVTWVNPPELEARIAKLEAELQRVAAIVYTIHGPYGPTDWVTGISRNTCHVSIPNSLTQQGIDECLSQVTIEKEEKE